LVTLKEGDKDLNMFRLAGCEGPMCGTNDKTDAGGTTKDQSHRVQPPELSNIESEGWRETDVKPCNNN
jgi:hypothetical protein